MTHKFFDSGRNSNSGWLCVDACISSRIIATFPISSALIAMIMFMAFSLTGVVIFAVAYAYLSPQQEAVQRRALPRPLHDPAANGTPLSLLTPASSVSPTFCQSKNLIYLWCRRLRTWNTMTKAGGQHPAQRITHHH